MSQSTPNPRPVGGNDRPENTAVVKAVVAYLAKELPDLHPREGIARDIADLLEQVAWYVPQEDHFVAIANHMLPGAPVAGQPLYLLHPGRSQGVER